ncbi:cytochrome b5-like heme/steroid binding domain-containing protein [Radiomyces spectabilis]|uniref:cytochrome b5-like heme/steroid binding domain-containing protein n=1 Tax=Radiomyces spectabilis TaxID=64574 RepID=UPI00221F7E18|nr:cytochrome b5-like heme/steroid binding domain-containing protein [Radiomyces spectabilis]KAI8376193.1 cytochrome b5-like heme/steroid binding domain-containing protein [Radiomyces spectabilis]
MGVTVLLWGIILFFLGSYLITETWTWGYRGKWTNLNTYIPASICISLHRSIFGPPKELVFSEEQLMRYDGSNPNLPIYVAIDGDVYDVTAGSMWYGLGASYHHFAGKDAARAYVTGCFQDHLTHDLRGLSEKQLKGVDHWKKFYENHHKYFKVGRVLHAPIDEHAPIPPPCKQAVGQKP